MGIELITKRDIIRSVRERFRKQYPATGHIARWSKSGRSYREMVSALEVLDLETCTEADVYAAIESNWTEHKCDECGVDCDALVHIGDEPDYEAQWVTICKSCLSRASDLV